MASSKRFTEPTRPAFDAEVGDLAARFIGLDVGKILDDAIEKALDPSCLLLRIVETKLRASGLRLSREERRRLKSACESASVGDLTPLETMDFSRKKGVHGNATIQLSDSDVRGAIKHAQRSIRSLVPILVKKSVRLLSPSFRASISSATAIDRREVVSFRKSIERSYGSAFRASSDFHAACLMSGEVFLGSLVLPRGLRRTAKRQAILRMHHRACRVALEVESLLRSGLSEGAMARWRTLHEIAVCSSFLATQSASVSRAFIHHEAVQRRKIENSSQSGGQVGSKIGQWDAHIDKLKLMYGATFTGDYGWAAQALQKSKPTFYDVEIASNFGHVREEYLKANSAVHASSIGLRYRPGLDLTPELGSDLDWVISTNVGVAVPAGLACWSLLSVTLAMLGTAPSTNMIVMMHLVTEMEARAVAAFSKAESRIHKRQAKYDKS